jgi:very-short-patch-repair endonuclease/rubredoxin
MQLQKKWICPKCGFPCRTRDDLRKHRSIEHADIAKNRPKPYSWECSICHQVFKSRRVLERHRADKDTTCYKRTHRAREWKCKYCNDVFNSRRTLEKHLKDCKVKKLLPLDKLGRVINYDALRRSQETQKQRRANGLYKSHNISERTRTKLSDARKKYLATHRVKYNWSGPLKQLSYAEQYFYDIVKSRCDMIHWANNLQVSYYRLDFANIDTKVYFEVDGEQHYDEYGKLHDIERTKKLAEKGWFLIARVRWKSFMQLNDNQKNSYVDELIRSFVSPDSNTIPPLPVPVEKENSKQLRQMAKEELRRQKQAERNRVMKTAEEQGLLRNNGWLNGMGVSFNEWNHRKELILNSGVDLMKFGWVGKVEQVTHLTKRVIEATLNRFPNEFKGKYFRRKLNQFDIKPE